LKKRQNYLLAFSKEAPLSTIIKSDQLAVKNYNITFFEIPPSFSVLHKKQIT